MKLKVISNIDHDGTQYRAGDTFEVENEAQANLLLESGAAEEVKVSSKPASKPVEAVSEATEPKESVEAVEPAESKPVEKSAPKSKK